MLQANIILVAGGLTGFIGAVANLKYFGIKQALIFIAFISMLVYLAYTQSICLVKGSCLLSSWISAAIAISTFSGIGVAYYYAIKTKTNTLQNSNLLTANPILNKVANFIQTRYNYNILE